MKHMVTANFYTFNFSESNPNFVSDVVYCLLLTLKCGNMFIFHQNRYAMMSKCISIYLSINLITCILLLYIKMYLIWYQYILIHILYVF